MAASRSSASRASRKYPVGAAMATNSAVTVAIQVMTGTSRASFCQTRVLAGPAVFIGCYRSITLTVLSTWEARM